MEESDEGAAAALGFAPQLLVNDVLNTIDGVRDEAFEYCLQEAIPKAVGAARAAEKAVELERGLNDVNRLVKVVLRRRMAMWEEYCLRHCSAVPEGFMAIEDDNSCANESHNDVTSDSDLDAKLDSLRRKLESAYKESENLQREMSSLERQTTYKRKFDSSVSEIQMLLEDKSVQKIFEDLAKAIPKLQQKIMVLCEKRAEARSSVYEQLRNTNGLRDNKRLALDKGFTASVEEVQEVVNLLNTFRKE